MERQDFLTQLWTPYPSAPLEPGWVFGRFERQDAEFLLYGEGPVMRYPVHQDLFLRDQNSDRRGAGALRVLRTGDWLAYRDPELVLLAPFLEEPQKAPGYLRGLPPRALEFGRFREKLCAWMRSHSFQEVSTPTLVPCPGTEPFLEPFVTELIQGRSRRRFYLPTSPELHLKKALAQGGRQIFELRPCFRNNEHSEKHAHEFWMLEWYRAFADLESLKEDCRLLLRSLTESTGEVLHFSQVSVAELFAQLGFDLRPTTTFDELRGWCERLGFEVAHYELWDDLFHLIFVERIEPFLPTHQPLFVVDYPPSQAALARVNAAGWAERFELYWRGYELANAYHELNDPLEQRRRSEADLELRLRLGKEALRLDEDFFAALRAGLPPSAGIALGVDRLFMALTGESQIQNLRSFSSDEGEMTGDVGNSSRDSLFSSR